jgi:hypothetical protein
MENQLRGSQLINTYGPGAMVELPSKSILIAGLDHWKYPQTGEFKISEPRLEAKITQLLHRGRPTHQTIQLRPPPPASDQHQGADAAFIKGFEFPLWFVSQHAVSTPEKYRRRRLVKSVALDGRSRFENHPVVSMRFVRGCIRGHCGDIQWHRFVHGEEPCPGELWVEERGTSGDLSDVWVICTQCGRVRCMRDATQREGTPLGKCNGARPWLNDRDPAGCSEPNRLLVRSASNSFFPRTVSVISIPDRGEWLLGRVRHFWESENLQAVENEPLVVFLLGKPHLKAAFEGFTPAEVFTAIQEVRSGRPAASTLKPIKEVEFEALSSAHAEQAGDDPNGDFFVRELPETAWRSAETETLQKVVLVHRLKEVQAQIGFTRFEPISNSVTGDPLDLDVKTAPLTAGAPKWVPAIENRGEGVFLQFRAEAIQHWLELEAVQARQALLQKGHKLWLEEHPGSDPDFPGLAYYLLHSISHLLIQSIALECGYPASSLRERIYVPAADGSAMAGCYGILLFTGSTDAHGTLGGLVQTGRDIRKHLSRSFSMARLCSNDPVCATHRPGQHTLNPLSGAACHSCLFISETSCERFNGCLDRALVAATIDHPGCEYIRSVP